MPNTSIQMKVVRVGDTNTWEARLINIIPPIPASKKQDPNSNVTFLNKSDDPEAPHLQVFIKDPHSRNAFRNPGDLVQPFTIKANEKRTLSIREKLGIGTNGVEFYEVDFRFTPTQNSSSSGGPGDTEIQIEC